MIHSIIVAMSQNRVIGLQGALPWHLPEDLKRFRNKVRGHPLIMGRKTFESMRSLFPESVHVVISRSGSDHLKSDRVKFVKTVDEALDLFKDSKEEVFNLGGGEIYKQTIHLADRIYLTVIHKNFSGDTYFPEFDESQYRVTFRENHEGPLPFTFIDYEK